MILKVKNFQKHSDLTLDLSSPITTIVGRTNAGKSSILRALRWLMLNQPRGDDWCLRWGTKEVSVTLEIGDHAITRIRDKDNRYILDNKEFKAFGSSVPDPIANILKVDDVNFAGQLDPHYWFHLTPGECAKELNRIVNLDRIDQTQAEIASRLRKARTEADVSESRLEGARTRRDESAWAEDAYTEFQLVEGLFEDLAETARKRSRIARIVEEGARLKEEYETASGATGEARIALQSLESWKDSTTKRKRLENLVKTITEEMEQWQEVKRNHTQIALELKTIKSCPFCGQSLK